MEAVEGGVSVWRAPIHLLENALEPNPELLRFRFDGGNRLSSEDHQGIRSEMLVRNKK